MTDSQRIEQLTDLLSTVIHTLELKMYDIEDPQKSHECEVEADQFHRQMLNILYPND